MVLWISKVLEDIHPSTLNLMKRSMLIYLHLSALTFAYLNDTLYPHVHRQVYKNTFVVWIESSLAVTEQHNRQQQTVDMRQASGGSLAHKCHKIIFDVTRHQQPSIPSYFRFILPVLLNFIAFPMYMFFHIFLNSRHLSLVTFLDSLNVVGFASVPREHTGASLPTAMWSV